MSIHVASNTSSITTSGATFRFIPAARKNRRAIRFAAALTLGFALCGQLRASQSASMAWNPVTNTMVTGYAFYLGDTNGVYSSRFDLGTNTAVTLTGLKEGQTKYFAVTAYNSAGIESPASPAASYIVPGLVRLVPPSKPGYPMIVTFPVAVGHSYEIQASTNFVNWSNLGSTAVSTSNTWFTYQDAQYASYPKRFYRLIMN